MAFLIAPNFVIHPQILILDVYNSESFSILIPNKIFHVTVLLCKLCNTGTVDRWPGSGRLPALIKC